MGPFLRVKNIRASCLNSTVISPVALFPLGAESFLLGLAKHFVEGRAESGHPPMLPKL